jgi:hypothetical protein
MTQGFVYIIESPAPADLLDGRTEGRVLSEALRLNGIAYEYSLAADMVTLVQALGDRLAQTWLKHKQPPILHLSMHGNAEGVVLTNGHFLSWQDLRNQLLPLLRAMPNALLICMSSCFGYSGCRIAMYHDSEPHFWALVGHADTVDWTDAAVAYVTFYHLFFKGRSVPDCVDAMKVASGDARFLATLGADTRRHWIEYTRNLQPLGLLGMVNASSSTAGSGTPSPGPAVG